MAAPFIAIWAPLEYFKTGEHVVEADIPSFKAVQGFNRSRNLDPVAFKGSEDDITVL
ncbi:hypothetical protein SNOG_14825 [Parastagonospora nodorum SN15]|uniref:Uncharacterized protein n=1 Tax=Phaeosphaeria nodorum (strain SN15 / ATCC MYA-4574 / FGSC 10173) TaxID=321614 RepID=Q0TZX4_PHANO|nr:hypothetical protein SNOG_14825 [Parastagonospora nodorum SN15]EAT77677.1 hypothetical protein SNOG_14825 [Parastagonospora nodorum SN15]